MTYGKTLTINKLPSDLFKLAEKKVDPLAEPFLEKLKQYQEMKDKHYTQLSKLDPINLPPGYLEKIKNLKKKYTPNIFASEPTGAMLIQKDGSFKVMHVFFGMPTLKIPYVETPGTYQLDGKDLPLQSPKTKERIFKRHILINGYWIYGEI